MGEIVSFDGVGVVELRFGVCGSLGCGGGGPEVVGCDGRKVVARTGILGCDQEGRGVDWRGGSCRFASEKDKGSDWEKHDIAIAILCRWVLISVREELERAMMLNNAIALLRRDCVANLVILLVYQS